LQGPHTDSFPPPHSSRRHLLHFFFGTSSTTCVHATQTTHTHPYTHTHTHMQAVVTAHQAVVTADIYAQCMHRGVPQRQPQQQPSQQQLQPAWVLMPAQLQFPMELQSLGLLLLAVPPGAAGRCIRSHYYTITPGRYSPLYNNTNAVVTAIVMDPCAASRSGCPGGGLFGWRSGLMSPTAWRSPMLSSTCMAHSHHIDTISPRDSWRYSPLAWACQRIGFTCTHVHLLGTPARRCLGQLCKEVIRDKVCRHCNEGEAGPRGTSSNSCEPCAEQFANLQKSKDTLRILAQVIGPGPRYQGPGR
jgi:hypothetical protein